LNTHGTFKPNNSLTRAHYAVFMYRAMNENNTTSNNGTNNTNSNSNNSTNETESTNFKNCDELREVYPDGVPSSHPAYQKKFDRDNDGWACER